MDGGLIFLARSKKLINDFTRGSIPKLLVRFMLPFVASNALQVVYSLVDMVVVGRYVGSAGLAGVSQGSIQIMFFTMFCMGFATSGQILISQLVGANRKNELNPVIGTLFSVTFIGSVILTVLALSLRGWLAEILRIPAEAREMAKDYVLYCGLGLLFSCGYNAVSSILRGMGDSKHPFIFITVSSVLNLILDIVLTGFLGWGVAGAAIATAFSQLVSCVASIVFLMGRKEEFHFDFKLPSFRIRKNIFMEMVKLGIPLALQTSCISISMMICNSFINTIGVAATAAFGVGSKVDDIANKVAMAIQYAAAPMVGQNIGAVEIKRAKSAVYWSWIFAGSIYLIFTCVCLTCGRQLFALFTSDADVIDLAPTFFTAMVLGFPAMALMRGTSSFLQGIGNGKLILYLAIVDSVARIVLSYLIGIVGGLGFRGFCLGFAFAAYGVVVPAIIYFFFAPWAKRRLAMAQDVEKLDC